MKRERLRLSGLEIIAGKTYRRSPRPYRERDCGDLSGDLPRTGNAQRIALIVLAWITGGLSWTLSPTFYSVMAEQQAILLANAERYFGAAFGDVFLRDERLCIYHSSDLFCCHRLIFRGKLTVTTVCAPMLTGFWSAAVVGVGDELFHQSQPFTADHVLLYRFNVLEALHLVVAFCGFIGLLWFRFGCYLGFWFGTGFRF